MVRQENECNRCNGVLRDPVTPNFCEHRFCKDCLREAANEELFKQGLVVTRRCFSCYRICLHGKVVLRCPVCKTLFWYKEPMPAEVLLVAVMLTLFLAATLTSVFFIAIGFVEWTHNRNVPFFTMLCGLSGSGNLFIAVHILIRELSYFRF